ncbi:hypothetical protein HDU97_008500 [Phlyctochytrium planicorne]|nr:hypothetical protein HDU97_008500 [Phlyctochytrium planicorne]
MGTKATKSALSELVAMPAERSPASPELRLSLISLRLWLVALFVAVGWQVLEPTTHRHLLKLTKDERHYLTVAHPDLYKSFTRSIRR